jgi:Ran GTPase-activating protein (RanGAP) involved in mRNA processing and transport
MPKITFLKDSPLDIQVSQQPFSSEDLTLDLSGNFLGRRGQEELIAMSQEIRRKSFNSVNMAKTGLHLINGGNLAEIIKALQPGSVVNLDLSSNWLGLMKTPKELSDIFIAVKELKSISLSGNGLGAMNYVELKQLLVLLNDTMLEEIKLDNNQFGKIGGPEFVAEFLVKSLGKKIVLEGDDLFTKQVRAHMQNVFTAPVYGGMSPK